MKKGVGFTIGSFAIAMSRSRNGIEAASAGIFRRTFSESGKNLRAAKSAAEKERPRSSCDDQKSTEIDFGRRRQNPQGRGEDGYDQCDCDRWERTTRERHTDRDEIENENANPDGRRCFVFPNAQANEHERQQRRITLPRRAF